LLVLFDLDGTITRYDTYRRFLIWVACRHPACWPNLWRLPLGIGSYLLKLQDNAWLKAHFLASIMGGLHWKRVVALRDGFLDHLMTAGLRSGAIEALKCHQQRGDRLVLATASFDFYARELAYRLGFERVICTRSAWDSNGCLIGTLPEGNCYGRQKVARIQSDLPRTWLKWTKRAYTDDHSDLPLMQWVEEPVPVHPTKKLAKWASRHGIQSRYW